MFAPNLMDVLHLLLLALVQGVHLMPVLAYKIHA